MNIELIFNKIISDIIDKSHHKFLNFNLSGEISYANICQICDIKFYIYLNKFKNWPNHWKCISTESFQYYFEFIDDSKLLLVAYNEIVTCEEYIIKKLLE